MLSFGSSPLEVLAREAMIRGLVYLDEFTYPWSWLINTSTALGANGDVTVTNVINSDSDFICQQYNLIAYAGGSLVMNPNLLMTVTRAGSGRMIMAGAVHVANFCGGYQDINSMPGQMPISSLYQGAMQVSIRMQNLSTTVFDRIDLSLRGFKVFYQTNQQGATGNRQDIFHAL